MIWEFKQQLFVSQRKVSPESVADLSNPAVRTQLQTHVDALATLPRPGAADEYAALFEAAYPSEADRRAYIDVRIEGGRPSYGHMALATLMRGGLTQLLWTTNFDTLIADACASVYGQTRSLTSVSPDTSQQAEHSISEQRWPIEVKLHGDFRSRRLKNTTDELRAQDSRLRSLLIDSLRRFGLVVVGYSGRDESVMSALARAFEHDRSYPAGLFWLLKRGEEPYDGVHQLLEKADAAQVDAALVKIDNFDEAMRDIVRLVPALEAKELTRFAEDRRRWTPAQTPGGRNGWPVVRLNALRVTHAPTVCRRVVCDIGGTADVRLAVEEAGVDVLAVRTRLGVLAFGSDASIQKAFANHKITEFDLHTFDARRLRIDSTERGLLRDALATAIARGNGLEAIKRRSNVLLAPADLGDVRWADLRRLVSSIGGNVSGSAGLRWREGLAIQLEWANDALMLIFEPRIIFDGLNDANKSAAADFARGRTVKRYNPKLNDLLSFWAAILSTPAGPVRALNIGDGVDASFQIAAETAFSWRATI